MSAGAAVGNLLPGDAGVTLDEDALLARLDSLLGKAVVYTLEVPQPMLDLALPVRGEEGRTVRGLAHHIAQVAYDPLRAAGGVPIVKAMHEYDAPAWLYTPQDVAAETQLVKDRLLAWSARTARPFTYGDVDYYQGDYTFHGLLERATWHAATHLRQLAWLLADAGVDRAAALTEADTHGLPIPSFVWK